ncbi:sulfite exporter TauE/SafE family protein [Candidatus Woesearchaeota archaeon]|nr:sulfite exporter TauE/SafE family protein [Candidatus Woesearchaeota archaeon]
MISGIYVVLVGFILGIQHAFDPDHIITVSNIISENRNVLKSSFLGMSWGLGHALTLFLAGFLLLVFKLSIPQQLALFAELVVGFMLVFLGIKTIIDASGFRYHLDLKHSHGEKFHEHLHHDDRHFHMQKPFIIGMIHGFAGTGALMLLVLGTVHSVFEGIVYISVFGIGSVIGMLFATTLIGLPFALSASRLSRINLAVKAASGILGILFGFFIVVTAFFALY